MTPTFAEVLRVLESRVKDDPGSRFAWGLLKRAARDCAYVGVKKGRRVRKEYEWEIVESGEQWLRGKVPTSYVVFDVSAALAMCGLSDLADDMGTYLAELGVWERTRSDGEGQTDC